MKKRIKCGWLFTAENEEARINMEVLVEGEKITGIGEAGAFANETAETIDLGNKFVMPGLIDAHTHVCMKGQLETTPVYQVLPGDIMIDAIENVRTDFMAGFTTLRDVGSVFQADIALRNAINQKRAVGPRMVVSGSMLCSTGGHVDGHFSPHIKDAVLGYVVDSADEARRAARLNFKYGADILKVAATGGVMSFGDAPGAVDLTYEEIKAAVEIADAHGHISSAHAHGAEGIKNAIRAGITSIEHGMLIDEEGIQMLAEHGTYLIPTIIAVENICKGGEDGILAPWMLEKAKQCKEKHQKNLQRMRQLGVKIGFGTDAGVALNYHGKQTAEFGLMVGCGFRPAETLLAATKVNAALLRMEDRIGSIEAGKLADIVAFEKNPLEDISVMAGCCFVMKDGVVYKNENKPVFGL